MSDFMLAVLAMAPVLYAGWLTWETKNAQQLED